MEAVDKAEGAGYFIQPPAAIVSSSPDGMRTVVVKIGPSTPILKTIEAPVSSGGDLNMSDWDARLRGVETDVAIIKERMTHMPTTMAMWSALAIVTLTVGGGVVTVLWWAIQGMLEPLLKATSGH
jgi:hypothetical protein